MGLRESGTGDGRGWNCPRAGAAQPSGKKPALWAARPYGGAWPRGRGGYRPADPSGRVGQGWSSGAGRGRGQPRRCGDARGCGKLTDRSAVGDLNAGGARSGLGGRHHGEEIGRAHV